MDENLVKFETRPDQIINLRVTSPWLLKKLLFDFVISITCWVLISYSWNLQVKWTWMKPQTSSKTGQCLIGTLILELHPPWLLKKKKFDIVISKTHDQIFLKFACKVDMDEISDKFWIWPDWLINLRVTFPWVLKKPLFDFVITVTYSVLIRSSWNLQIRWTWMESQMS